MPLFHTDQESPESSRIHKCKDLAVFMEKCKFFNSFLDVLRFSYETGRKLLQIFTGFGWIRHELPRYCAKLITMCNSIFGNTAISSRIDRKLVKKMLNAAQSGHELTKIGDQNECSL